MPAPILVSAPGPLPSATLEMVRVLPLVSTVPPEALIANALLKVRLFEPASECAAVQRHRAGADCIVVADLDRTA